MSLKKNLLTLFTKRDLRNFILIFFGILLTGVFEVIGIASIAPFMTIVSSPEMAQENEYLALFYNFVNAKSHKEFVIILGLGVILAISVSNTYQAFMAWVMTNFSRNQTHHLSVRLLRQYLFQPYSFFLNRNTSEMGKNIVSEVSRGVAGVLLPLLSLASKSVISISIFALLFAIEPLIALISLLVFGGIYGALFLSVKNRLKKIGIETTDAATERFKIASESMSGIKEIKLRGSENIFLELFFKHSETYARNYAIRALLATIPRYFIEVLAFGGIVAIILSLLMTGKTGTEIIALISVYAMAGYRLLPVLQAIYANLTSLKFNLPIIEVLAADFRDDAKIQPSVDDKAELIFEEKIDLEQIHFSYDNGQPVLTGVNLCIDCNTTVGLVGSTGSGKTTLVDIILGLLDPKQGSIKVDSIKINQDNSQSWQRKLGYVPQSIFLLDDTIKRNIAFSASGNQINDERIIEVAKMANLHQYITTLSDGYNSKVGERGVRLSGGQIQRIGIARALYNNPEVLILDEATSALDSVTENVVMEAIHNLSNKKTIIMIAHRLSTIKECDVIYFLDKGKIADSGSYNELIKSNQKFKEMSNML